MVTGPMPRKPNATRPNANTVAAAPHANGVIASALSPVAPAAARFCEYRRSVRPAVDEIAYAIAISAAIVRPIQSAETLPAVSPDRMLSDGPPSFDAVTTSQPWPALQQEKTFPSSGIIAPASVPHEMIADSFHHRPNGI